MHPRVVNVRAPGATWDVYIGRGPCPRTGLIGRWGNPYTAQQRAPLSRYIDWLGETWNGPEPMRDLFRARLREQLEGKVLGCWCAPAICHGDVLARLAEGQAFEDVRCEVLAQIAAAAEHRCHARGCTTPVPPRLLMCARHWRMVPKDLQQRVWAHCRPGQEVTKDPTREYLEVAQAAIRAVALKEGAGQRLLWGHG